MPTQLLGIAAASTDPVDHSGGKGTEVEKIYFVTYVKIYCFSMRNLE